MLKWNLSPVDWKFRNMFSWSPHWTNLINYSSGCLSLNHWPMHVVFSFPCPPCLSLSVAPLVTTTYIIVAHRSRRRRRRRLDFCISESRQKTLADCWSAKWQSRLGELVLNAFTHFLSFFLSSSSSLSYRLLSSLHFLSSGLPLSFSSSRWLLLPCSNCVPAWILVLFHPVVVTVTQLHKVDVYIMQVAWRKWSNLQSRGKLTRYKRLCKTEWPTTIVLSCMVGFLSWIFNRKTNWFHRNDDGAEEKKEEMGLGEGGGGSLLAALLEMTATTTAPYVPITGFLERINYLRNVRMERHCRG